jgi:hypothetical protein
MTTGIFMQKLFCGATFKAEPVISQYAALAAGSGPTAVAHFLFAATLQNMGFNHFRMPYLLKHREQTS